MKFDHLLKRNKKNKKCRSNSYIEKWLSDKMLMILTEESWIDFNDFDMPIKSKIVALDWQMMKGSKIMKSLKL